MHREIHTDIQLLNLKCLNIATDIHFGGQTFDEEKYNIGCTLPRVG